MASGAWTCSVCTYINESPVAPVCGICGTQRYADDTIPGTFTHTSTHTSIGSHTVSHTHADTRSGRPPSHDNSSAPAAAPLRPPAVHTGPPSVHACVRALREHSLAGNARAIACLRAVIHTLTHRRGAGAGDGEVDGGLPRRDVSGLPTAPGPSFGPARAGHSSLPHAHAHPLPRGAEASEPIADAEADALYAQLTRALADLSFMGDLLRLLTATAEALPGVGSFAAGSSSAPYARSSTAVEGFSTDTRADVPASASHPAVTLQANKSRAETMRRGVRLPTGEIVWETEYRSATEPNSATTVPLPLSPRSRRGSASVSESAARPRLSKRMTPATDPGSHAFHSDSTTGASFSDVIDVLHGLLFRMSGAGEFDVRGEQVQSAVNRSVTAALQTHGPDCVPVVTGFLRCMVASLTCQPFSTVTHRQTLQILTYLPTIWRGTGARRGTRAAAALPQVHAVASALPVDRTNAERSVEIRPSPAPAEISSIRRAIAEAFATVPSAVPCLLELLRYSHDSYDDKLRLHSTRYRAARLLRVLAAETDFRKLVMTSTGIPSILQAVVSSGYYLPECIDERDESSFDEAILVDPLAASRVVLDDNVQEVTEARIPEDLVFCLWEAMKADPQTIVEALVPSFSSGVGDVASLVHGASSNAREDPYLWLTTALYHPNLGVTLGSALLLAALAVHPTSRHAVGVDALEEMEAALSQLHPAMLSRVGRQSVGTWPKEDSSEATWLRLMIEDERPPVQLVGCMVLAVAGTHHRPILTSDAVTWWAPTFEKLASTQSPFVFVCAQWIRHCLRRPLHHYRLSSLSVGPASNEAPPADERTAVSHDDRGKLLVISSNEPPAPLLAHSITRTLEQRPFLIGSDVLSLTTFMALDVSARKQHIHACGGIVILLTHDVFCGTPDSAFWVASQCALGFDDVPVACVASAGVIIPDKEESAFPGSVLDALHAKLCADFDFSDLEFSLDSLLSLWHGESGAAWDVELALQRHISSGQESAISKTSLPVSEGAGAEPARAPVLRARASSTLSGPMDPPIRGSGLNVLPVVPSVATGAEQIQAVHDLQAIFLCANRHYPLFSVDFGRGMRAAADGDSLLRQLRICEMFHFTGHGDPYRPLHFAKRDAHGIMQTISLDVERLTQGIARLAAAGGGPRVLVFMGCHTANLAYQIACRCPDTCILAWATQLDDAAAVVFCELFYSHLFQIIADAVQRRCPHTVGTTDVLVAAQGAIHEMKTARGFAFIDPTYPRCAFDPASRSQTMFFPCTADGAVARAAGVPVCLVPTAPAPLLPAWRWMQLGLLRQDDVPVVSLAAETSLPAGSLFTACPTFEGAHATTSQLRAVHAEGTAAAVSCFMALDFDFLQQGMMPATCRRHLERARLEDFVHRGEWSTNGCEPRLKAVTTHMV